MAYICELFRQDLQTTYEKRIFTWKKNVSLLLSD